jgi:hypothetical protein
MEQKITLGKRRRGWKYNIKMYLKDKGWEEDMD